ncbi:MAG TPA: hypothetical protein VMW69_16900, partial [Spirochaetia bacterium]|nr:hypothetical protein [Spirochaetia bacterium]
MRIEVVYRGEELDGRAGRLAGALRRAAGTDLGRIVLVDVYLLAGLPQIDRRLAGELFADQVAQESYVDDTDALLARFSKTS